jgi:hypothetical protein
MTHWATSTIDWVATCVHAPTIPVNTKTGKLIATPALFGIEAACKEARILIAVRIVYTPCIG